MQKRADGLLDEVSVRTVVVGALAVVAVGLAFLFVARFYFVLFLLLVAAILATVTRPAVDWLARRGIRREIGVILVYLVILAALALFALLVAPLILGQLGAVVDRLPELYSDFRTALLTADNRVVARLARGLPAVFALPAAAPIAAQPDMQAFEPAWNTLQSAGQGAFFVVAILVLAFYWVLEGEVITRRALFFVRADMREEVRVVWGEMEAKIGAFFRGQLILMGAVALLTLIGYTVAGMPYALGLALIAGVCEAIPIVGPTIAIVPAALVAISLAPDKLPLAVGVGVIVQLLENNLLVPRIMDQSVGVNPVITILAIAAFGALFGLAGALLAIPLAAMVQIIVARLAFSSEPNTDVGRSRVSILRLATQELAADVRRASRSDNDPSLEPETERAQDMIESIALDLDSVLSKAEAEQ